MENFRKELILSRIVSGITRVSFFYDGEHRTLLIRNPSRQARYYSNEIYAEAYEKAQYEGLYDNQSLLGFLYANKIWDDEKANMLTQLEKNIEEFKIKMYQLVFKSSELKTSRKALAITKSKLSELFDARHSYDHLTIEGFAGLTKLRYLVGMSICDIKGKRLFNNDTIWACNAGLIEKVIEQSYKNLISETEYRELARTEPWRTIWNNKKSEHSVFGLSAVDLSLEQKNLSLWSSIYDSIYEHPECPPDDVVEDDDILDGWMLIQRQKRGKSLLEKRTEALLSNDKLRKAEEIYIPVDTVEDARKIDELNDVSASIIKQQRMNYLKKKGEVNELDMPDTKRRFRTAIQERATQLMTGKG